MAPKRHREENKDSPAEGEGREHPIKEIKKMACQKVNEQLGLCAKNKNFFHKCLLERLPGGQNKAIRRRVSEFKDDEIPAAIRRAMENIVVIGDFCLREFQEALDAHVPSEATAIRKSLSDIFDKKEYEKLEYKSGVAIVDCEGELLLLRLPELAKKAYWPHAQNTMQQYLSSPVFNKQKCSAARGGVDTYLKPSVRLEKGEKGYRPGMQHLAFWHATGHTKQAPKPSADLVAPAPTPSTATTVDKVLSAQGFLGKTRFLQELVNATYEAVSPQQSKRLIAVRDQMNKDPATKALLLNQGCHFHSMAVLSNKWTDEHLDEHSYWHMMDPMIAGGDFDDGDLFLPDLKLEVPFHPGDLILILGKALTHGTRKWTGKKRASLVYFIHHEVLTYVERCRKEELEAKEERKMEQERKRRQDHCTEGD